MLLFIGAIFIIAHGLLKVMQIVDNQLLNWTCILFEAAAIIYFVSIKMKEKRVLEKN